MRLAADSKLCGFEALIYGATANKIKRHDKTLKTHKKAMPFHCIYMLQLQREIETIEHKQRAAQKSADGTSKKNVSAFA